ncbi:MAG: MraY family glycosyltransferase [bacterium]
MVSFLFTVGATSFLLKFLISKRFFDIPDFRKLHNHNTPKMGGLVIISVFFIGISVIYHPFSSLLLILIGFIIIAICGIVDDLIGLKWFYKLVLQFFSTIFILLFYKVHITGIILFNYQIPEPFGMVILILFIVGAINSINLMDGLDGLVPGYSILVLLYILIFSILVNNTLVSIFSIILIGALFGFLKYNIHPAKIFLGDTGSLFLGYSLVFLSIYLSFIHEGEKIDITFPAFLLIVPMLDMFKVITIRLYHKKNPFLPDNNHLHFILLKRVGHKTTVFMIHLISVLFLIITAEYFIDKSNFMLILFIVLGVLLLFIDNIIDKIEFSLKYLKKEYLKIKFPSPIKESYIKAFPYFLIFFLIFLMFPIIKYQKTPFTWQLYLFFSIEIVILFFALYNFKKTLIKHQYYFIFNVFRFFAMTQALMTDNNNVINKDLSIINIVLITSISVIFILIIYLVLTERFLISYDGFFSSIDLFIIVVVALISLLNLFVGVPKGNYFSLKNVFIGYNLYLWLKIMSVLKPKSIRFLLIFSFCLPIFYIIKIHFI